VGKKKRKRKKVKKEGLKTYHMAPYCGGSLKRSMCLISSSYRRKRGGIREVEEEERIISDSQF
jgi:transcription elongation factor Elf1